MKKKEKGGWFAFVNFIILFGSWFLGAFIAVLGNTGKLHGFISLPSALFIVIGGSYWFFARID